MPSSSFPMQSGIAGILKSIGAQKKKKALEDTLDKARKKGYDISIELDPTTGKASYKLNYKSKKDYKDLLTEKWRQNPKGLTPEELKYIGAYVKPEKGEGTTDDWWKKPTEGNNNVPPTNGAKKGGFDISNLFKIFANRGNQNAGMNIPGSATKDMFGDVLGATRSSLQNLQGRSRMTPQYSQTDAKAILWLKQKKAPLTPANIKAVKQKFGWTE